MRKTHIWYEALGGGAFCGGRWPGDFFSIGHVEGLDTGGLTFDCRLNAVPRRLCLDRANVYAIAFVLAVYAGPEKAGHEIDEGDIGK